MSGLILASGSATRRRLLADAGVTFSVEIPNVDEGTVLESLMAEGARAREAADVLAELKAVQVSARQPTAFAIGADQILSVEREFFRKPGDVAAARDQLNALRG